MYRFFESHGLDLLAGYIHIAKQIGDLGHCRLSREFVCFTGALTDVEARDARQSPKEFSAALAAGKTLVLTGPYAYIDGVYRYCQRQERQLVAADEFSHITHRGRRKAELAKARRNIETVIYFFLTISKLNPGRLLEISPSSPVLRRETKFWRGRGI